MTDVEQAQQEAGQQEIFENQKYLQGVLNKFNANPEDPDLTDAERILLRKVVSVEKEMNELVEQFDGLNGEVAEKQEQMNTINQQLLLKKGQSQGLVDSLLALR